MHKIGHTPIHHFVFLLFVFSISCKKSEDRTCLKPLGQVTTQIRQATAFDSIYLHDNINLILTQDTVHSIFIEAPENLLNFVKTNISENTLTITNDNKCSFLRSYRHEINVYVSVVKLAHINFTGSGKITSSNTIKASYLRIDFWNAGGILDISLDARIVMCNLHTGSGDVTLKGSSREGYFYSNGNGFMHLENFVCAGANVQNKGTGDLYVNVQNELSIIITSEGSVFYAGNPTIVHSELSGTGKLVQISE